MIHSQPPAAAFVAIAAIIALLIYGWFTSFAVLLIALPVAAFAGLWGWRAAIRERSS